MSSARSSNVEVAVGIEASDVAGLAWLHGVVVFVLDLQLNERQRCGLAAPSSQ